MAAPELAIERLYALVTARFADEGNAVPQLFGWRKPTEQIVIGRRIVWVPGDQLGNVGQIEPASKNAKTYMRSLATLDELFTVYVFGVYTLQPEQELQQYKSARLLYDAWYRALYLACRGNFRVLSQTWLTEHRERVHGAGIRVVVAVSAAIPDEPYDPGGILEPPHADAETGCALTVNALDHSSEVEIAE